MVDDTKDTSTTSYTLGLDGHIHLDMPIKHNLKLDLSAIAQPPKNYALEDIIDHCTDAQEEFVNDLFLRSTLEGDYTVYSMLTGITPELVPEDLPIPEKSMVPQGRYSMTVDLPDLSCFDDHTRYSVTIKLLQNNVIYKILAPILKKDNPGAYYTYFKDIMRPSTEDDSHDSQEDLSIIRRLSDGEAIRPMLRNGAREALGGILKQYAVEILTHIGLDDTLDFKKGARVHVNYVVDADGKLDVSTARKKYLEQYTQGMTIKIPDENQRAFKKKVEEMKEKVGLDDQSVLSLMQDNDPVFNGLEVLIIRNLLDTQHPEVSKFYIVDDDTRDAHLTEAGYKVFKPFITKSLDALSYKISCLPDIDGGGLLRIVCDVDDDKIREVKLSKVTFDPDKRVHIRGKLPNVERMDKDEKLDSYEDDAMTHALEMMAACMNVSDPDNFKKYFELYQIYREGEWRDSYRFTDAGREKFLGMGKQYGKYTDAITEGMESLEEVLASPFYLELKPAEPQSPKPEVKAKRVYLDYGEEHMIDMQVPASQSGVLDRPTLEQISKMLVDVTRRVIAQDMHDIEHPRFDEYCKYDQTTEGYDLTDKGIESLAPLIKSMSSELAMTILQARSQVPEHLKGFGMSLKYGINPDDSFSEIDYQTYR